ncbi:MAG: MarR family transcriptional regulator [Bacteroidales bacterium]|nr:MarR family transcriptional regulator [Bacteroidales bacterium]
MKNEMHYQFDRSLGKVTQQITRALGQRFVQKCRGKGLSVNAEQWTILSLLFHRGAQTQKEIGLTLYMDKVSVTRTITRLENRGLLIRLVTDSDRRVNQVSLTDLGRGFYLRLEPLAAETIAEALHNFSEEESDYIFTLLERIRSNLIG